MGILMEMQTFFLAAYRRVRVWSEFVLAFG